MNRYGGLFERIVEWDNIRLAYYLASKGKRTKPDVLDFRHDLDINLDRVRNTLLDPNISGIGDYRFFTILDPKERKICAAPFFDRVLHHAVMHVLEPYFESFQIYDSYACRVGKGTDAAIRRALYFARRYGRFAKLDVRAYFDSIDHAKLNAMIERRFKDRRVVRILEAIIDSYHIDPGKGVPIGNLTSQFFANHYLAFLDHDIKERLRLHGYVRYMDDMLLFGDSGEELRNVCSEIERFCSDELALELKPPIISRTSAGAPFLGFLVKPKGVYLTRKKRRRTKRRLGEFAHKYLNGDWNESELADHILPVCAHLALARSRWIRNTLIERAGLGHEPGSSRR